MSRFSLFKSVESKWIQISLGLLCTFLIALIKMVDLPTVKGPINITQYAIYDYISSLFLHPYKEITKVFIVDIDDYSIAKEGRWPWPRDKLATILANLKNAGVVTAGIDIVMSNPEINYATGLRDRLNTISNLPVIKSERDNVQLQPSVLQNILTQLAPQVDNDQALATALKNYDVTLGFLFHELTSVRTGTLPAPLTNSANRLISPSEFNAREFHGYNASIDLFIKASGHGGFVSNILDVDGSVRRGLMLGRLGDKVYASLSLMTSMRFLLADHVDLKMHKTILGDRLYGIDVAGTFIPTTDKAEILIPFWGLPFTLPYIRATDILHGKFDAKSLEGAVAIVGSSALMLADIHPAPVSRAFPGVEMVGNMVAGIIGQQLIIPFDWMTYEGVFGFFTYGIIISFLLPFLGTLLLIVTTLSFCALLIGVCVYLYFFKSIYVPMGSVFILTVVQGMINYTHGFILEKRQKHKIKQLFSQYVPETYVQELISANASSSMEGETKELSVLFSDIRSFTSTSEGLDAVDVKRLLNTFFTPITEIIFNHQGTIDKYVGDMVIAFWGAPIPIENQAHARQAILAALHIFKNLPSINEQMIENGLPAVHIGIGIGTGLMNVGDMGSKFRRAYTVLGDEVNLASRLESLTKYYGVNILVNDLTRNHQEEFLWRAVDKVEVKGRKTALTIYEPLGFVAEVSSHRIAEINLYHSGLDLYYAQNWSAAAAVFKQLREEHPDTYLYQLYSTRIERFADNPPAAEWEGVFVHTEK